MKKVIFILLSVFILLVFCACSNDSTDKNTTKLQDGTMTNTNVTENFDNTITVKIGNKSFSAKLYNNDTAKAFADMLPLTLDMNELNGNEKYFNLNKPLPNESEDVAKINSGDIMLYGSDCIVLFYDSFSTNYTYTKVGYIENPTDLAKAVGSEDITITFYK